MSAPRVTDADVQAIVPTDLDTAPFITAAHLLVDRVLLPAGVDEATLTSIELFVASSYVAKADPRAVMKAMGDLKVQYEGGNLWEQLWQIAVSLDPTGLLSQTTTMRPATFAVD